MEAILRDFLEALPEPAVLLDGAGRALAANAAFAARGPAAIAGRPLGELLDGLAPECERDPIVSLAQAAARGEAPPERDYDDGRAARRARARRLPETGRVLLTLADVTAERAARDERARAAARLEAVLDASADATVTIDVAGVVRAVNRAAVERFGYAPEEIVGRNVAVLMPEELAGSHDRFLSTYLETGEARIIGRGRALDARAKDGRRVPIELTVREARVGEERFFVGLMRDLTAAERAREALDRSAAQVRLALQAGRLGAFDVDLATGAVEACARFRAIFGLPEGAPVRFPEVRARLRPDDAQRLDAAIEAAAASGADLDIEAQIAPAEGSPRSVAFRGRVTPLDGAPHLVGVAGDITERREAERRRLREERQSYVVAEMRHRTKNLFSMVRAILNLTGRGHPEAQAFKEAVEHRLGALEAAQTRLSATSWRSARLCDIVDFELAPWRVRRADVAVSGEELALNPHAAQIFAMVVHELATNAAKHGALSAPGGRLRVEWTRIDDRVSFTWREENGPPVAPPTRAGFGTTVIVRMVERMLGGSVEAAYPETGFRYGLTVPEERLRVKDAQET